VVLAVSDESPKDVESYVKSTGLRLKVGAGFSGGAAWGVSSYPSSALVSPEGKLLWLGHPSHVTTAMIESALPDTTE
jgi:hypothetical protein